MQMIFQDPFAALDPRLTVEQIISEPLEIHKIGSAEERIAEVARAARSRRLAAATRIVSRPSFPADSSSASASPARSPCAQTSDLRRTGFRARRFRSGADLESFARFAGRIRFFVSFHFAQHRRHGFYEPAHRRDVSGKISGNRREPGNRRRAAASVHAGSDRRDSRARPVRNVVEAVATGEVPSPIDRPSGCPFHLRCPSAQEICAVEAAAARVAENVVACHFADREV